MLRVRSILALVLPATVGVVVPWLIARSDPWRGSGCPAGFLLVGCGPMAVLWCARDFYIFGRGTLVPWSPPQELVVVGLYRVVRNPMYWGLLSLILGVAWWQTSPLAAAYAAVVGVAVHLRVSRHEEPALRRKYPERWRLYAGAVRRWLPPLRPWRLGSRCSGVDSLAMITARLPLLALGMTLGLLGCGSTSGSELRREADESVARFKRTDPAMIRRFEDAVGYAVFPAVAKGGMQFGGAYGNGVLYERGTAIGQARLIQVTVGIQVGGQVYAEVVLFNDNEALRAFKEGQYALAAQVSAVAAAEGVALNAKYREGVAVVTLAKVGIMVEATVGAQKFSFDPFRELVL